MAERATVAVIDAGGRGAALVESYAKSPHVERILAIPGNDLMQLNSDKPVETFQNLKTTSVTEIIAIAKENNVALVDVAQDDAVAVNLSGRLAEAGITALGPTREAGEIEWSKSYARRLGTDLCLLQPRYGIYDKLKYVDADEIEEGFAKADGLAAGKGARKFDSRKEKLKVARGLRKDFPQAAQTIIIEQLLSGEELSAFAFMSGRDAKRVGTAQDNKRSHKFDEGENTGGMGGHAPPLITTDNVLFQIDHNFAAIAKGLTDRDRPYYGVVYQGAMVDPFETVNLVEWNSRWGDPEAQLLLPGFQFDMYEAAMTMIHGGLKDFDVPTDGKVRVVFAAASRGYPGDVSAVKGKRIWGIDEAMQLDGVHIYGAGVKRVDGKDYANGGRLLYVLGEGEDIIEARERALAGLSHIHVEDNNLLERTDIAWRDVQRLRLQGR